MAVRGLIRLASCVAFMLLVLVTTLCEGQQYPNLIELVDGSYRNILIAISKEVPEDRKIIDNLKEMFTDGSRTLFSDNRVYCKSFTILVPPNWPRRPDYEVARIEAYENANVVVTESKNNHPSVLQPFGRGKQGRYIELSRQYVTGKVSLENEIGVRGKVLVEQFAKLRWGVFDESGVTPPVAADTDTTPVFRIVQQAGPLRVVLVLDISASMEGSRSKMIKGTRNYILNVVPDGSQLGIVVFNNVPMIRSNLSEITDSHSRKRLVDFLPNTTGNGTCIGFGILEGIKVLGHNDKDTQGGVVVLLSDFEENLDTKKIESTLGNIKSAGVIMHTIAFGSAHGQLKSLANTTGGTSAACPDGRSALCVIDALTATISRRAESIAAEVPTQVLGWTGYVEAGYTEDVPALIDASLGTNTVFAVFWSHEDIINVTITRPNGDIMKTPSNDIIEYPGMIFVTINDTELGTWTVKITKEYPGSHIFDVVVTSKLRSADVDPIVVNSFLGTTSVDFTSNYPRVEVYALVHSNYEPVLKAQVIATVGNGTDSGSTVDLLDNGRGADVMAGDGVYSGYILVFTGNGSYGVNVRVNGTNARVQKSAIDLAFNRMTTGGVFQVVNYVEGSIMDFLTLSNVIPTLILILIVIPCVCKLWN